MAPESDLLFVISIVLRNGISKSSKLVLSLLYYHMCAISMEWQTPPPHLPQPLSGSNGDY